MNENENKTGADLPLLLMILTQKNRALEQENAYLKKELTDAENILKQTKSQYAELMNTVQGYKEEASKWHYLYYSRKKI